MRTGAGGGLVLRKAADTAVLETFSIVFNVAVLVLKWLKRAKT